MPAETCDQCGLPQELCVCEDMEKSESPDVTISLTDAGFADKQMTIIQGLTEQDANRLDSELKSALGAGGTTEEVTKQDGSTELEIHLQGDHTNRDKLVEILEDAGYELHFQE